MIELFKDYPEAISNTLIIAEQCDVNIPMGELFLPKFPNNLNLVFLSIMSFLTKGSKTYNLDFNLSKKSITLKI